MRVKQRANKLLLSSLCLLPLALSVQAQESFIEEVIVTAQKRVQSAQDVPVSVTAYTGENLNELGITDIFDLQSQAPGLIASQSQNSTTASFSIRGVGTSSQNFGLESSVGLYVDGVYRARQSSVINELIDIAAVEVLRGPQGTLFGRNTPSGAIQINTKKPSHDEDGFINVGVGDLGLFSANGAVGGSIVEDTLAYRITAFTTQRDGLGDVEGNTLNEKEVINDRDRYGFRAQLLFTPSDTFSARVIADYSEIDEICCSVATLRNNFFSFNGTPGTDFLLTALGANIVSEDRQEDNVTALNSLPISQNEDTGISLEMNWDLANGGTITSVTAYRNFESFTDNDSDFSDAPLFRRLDRGDSTTLSQELRYTFEGDKLDYVVGGFYYDQDLDSGAEFIPGPAFAPFFLFNPGVQPLLQAAAAFGIPVANPLPAGTSSRDFFEQDQKAFAIFGQFDYDITENLTLTAGLRYTDETKEVDGRFIQDSTTPPGIPLLSSGNPASLANLAFPGWGYTLGGPLVSVSDRPAVNAKLEDDQITGTIKLSYFTDENTMFFVSYGTGYKSGGTNTDRISPAFETLFDAETSESLEIGMKKDFPNQNLRVNLTLHATDTEDFQTNSFVGSGFNLQNAGTVETRGGELEISWFASETLKINGALVINDGEYASFVNGNCFIATPFQTGIPDATSNGNGSCDRSGGDLPTNPSEIFMIAATKDFAIGSKSAYVHGDYFYRSSTFEDGNLDPLKEQDGYGLLNLKAGIYLTDNSELSFWMRNALDEDYFGTYFDVPIQDGKLNAYNREGRTYGVNYRYDF